MKGELWVCWEKPDKPGDGPHPRSLGGTAPSNTEEGGGAALLSFLPPAVEDEVKASWSGPFIHARESSQEVRGDARRLYIDIVARIGLSPIGGKTFRQALAPKGEASVWWYHPSSAKDCESDPAFEGLIAALTIRNAAVKLDVSRIVLVGAAPELRAAFGESTGAHWVPGDRWARGLASRLKMAATLLRQRKTIRARLKGPDRVFDLALFGFWDWSFWNGGSLLEDRYFKNLPEEVSRAGIARAWFAWLDPDAEPGKTGRRLADVLAPLAGRTDVVLLQTFLKPVEIVREALNFSPLRRFLKLRKDPAFRAGFREGPLDLYPLFAEKLLKGFLDSTIPRLTLVARATQRAVARHKPRISLSFLEHYPFSRAHYEGARRAGGVWCAAVQHCCYSREKTFLFFDPKREFGGEPEGFGVPHPEKVFAMGTLGRELFLECGYDASQVAMTGSPRYDHLRELPPLLPLRTARFGTTQRLRLLMLSGLDTDLEIEMVKAAFAAAGKGVKLLLRDHPFNRIADHGRFGHYKERVEITKGTLEEDLREADLILFTYSAAAEEALLRGKPVWQWVTLRYNGSALTEAARVPRFTSVSGLREAIETFRADPRGHLPSEDLRRAVFERLFAGGSEAPSAAITGALKKRLAAR